MRDLEDVENLNDTDDLTSDDDAWWSWTSLASAPGLAVCGFVFAVVSLLGLSPAHELSAAVQYSLNTASSVVRYYWIDAVIQGAVALLGGWLCTRVLRNGPDDELAWTGGLARAGLLISALSVVLNVATIVAAFSASDHNALRF